jgi:pilus assembly protein CpaF
MVPADEPVDRLAAELHEAVVRDIDLSPGLEAAERIEAVVEREAGFLAPPDRRLLAERIAGHALAAGPLERLLRDPTVDEILVDGTEPIWVERAGRLEQTPSRFATEGELREAIERLLTPAGRRVDEAQPLCDARLPDGSRVNVVLPPLAVDGPALTVRRFRPSPYSASDLVALGTWDAELLALFEQAVEDRQNIVICGGTGSGKTTTLAAVAGMLAPGERIVTVEDTAELRLPGEHVVRLESRPPAAGGHGAVTIRDLVRNALRMRPDRIIVGEVRGAEALDLISALCTGHDGSLSTVHAGSPAEALERLVTLALMAGVGLPHGTVVSQVAAAVDLVAYQSREAGGGRMVVSVQEVVGNELELRDRYRRSLPA